MESEVVTSSDICPRNCDMKESVFRAWHLKEASLSAALSSTNIRIVEQASPPRAPFSPDIPRNLGIGLIIGLTTGVALAVSGRATFNRSGRAAVPKNASYVDVTPPGGVASTANVLATLQTYRSGVYVAAPYCLQPIDLQWAELWHRARAGTIRLN